jgi:hypothetical protein
VPGSVAELDRQTETVAGRADVERAAALTVYPIRMDGVPVQGYGLDASDPDEFVHVIEGRLPQAPNEVLVGSETLDRLGGGIGGEVVGASLEGRGGSAVTVVGRGVFPEFVQPSFPDSDAGAYNDFALFTREGAQRLADAGGHYFGLSLVEWTAGTDHEAAAASLEQQGLEILPPDRPPNLDNLTRVRWFPPVVAGFLVVLAGMAAAHALVVSVQRRARELALLRTLGFVGGQVRATVAWQATTVAVVGLLLGVPAGLILGRVVWGVAAGNLGVDTDWSVPVLAVLLVLPASVAVANVIASVPARAAARARLGPVLRTE